MPITDFPFLCLRKNDVERPWLPVRITNPHTRKHIDTYGLIDTGADDCTMPAFLTEQLGHKLENGTAKPVHTAGGLTTAYSHTTTIEIFDIKQNKVIYSIPDKSIDFSEGLNIVLLGVRSFLDNFTLKINYPKRCFSIKNS
ncbi:MAG TPA: hypothetical protein ENG83_10920 [Nitrospirae bacterium]|nr:hypothetical protein BMS3Abin06_01538 [bacterium BMS3Abin06]HDH12684.1 hypothetical protein [Nitrospirota bacterium]HDY99992.1 hypothetical protein [Nitrospirota bacterium]